MPWASSLGFVHVLTFLLGVLSSAVEQDSVARNLGMCQGETLSSDLFLQDSTMGGSSFGEEEE